MKVSKQGVVCSRVESGLVGKINEVWPRSGSVIVLEE